MDISSRSVHNSSVSLFFATAVFILLLSVIQASAQQSVAVKKPSPPVTSIISGRVFGITQSGDLKPARFVDVYLLLQPTATQAAKHKDKSEESVYTHFLVQEAIGQMKAIGEGVNSTEERACLSELLAINQALSDSIQWASDNHQQNQIYTTQTDEDGKFKIAVRPATYLVLANGEAGFNRVFWQQDNVRVLAGGHTGLKLHDAKKACNKSAD